ncbi:murein hydrolase activator EnvC family protein [Myroides sp. LJL115]
MRSIYITLVLSLCTLGVYAQQTQAQLERKKQQILIEIKSVQKLLQVEQTKERNILSEIQEYNRKISLNQALIKNVQQQIQATNRTINQKQAEITKLQKEIEVLKQDYAQIIVKSYQSKSNQSKLMYILSSDNFLQAYKRVQYLKQYAQYRNEQAIELQEKAKVLDLAIADLEKQKVKQRALLAEQQKSQKALEDDLGKQKELIALVKKDQKTYNAQIVEKQKQTDQIDRQIKKLIQEAIALANKKAREAAGKSTTSTSTAKATFELTPEGKIEASNFKANKGRLPWPVEKGYVSLGYGDQPHHTQKHLTIHNSGLEISTEPGSKARAVFQGEVLQVQVLSGGNKAVLIQHGDYITVYQNLNQVWVSPGQKVTLKQDIGTINTNSSGKTILKFLLTHNTDINNPQLWLTRSN